MKPNGNKVSHSEAPWKIEAGTLIIHKETGRFLGHTFEESQTGIDFYETRANAQHIVHCVNSHKKLAEAQCLLKELTEYLIFTKIPDKDSTMDILVKKAMVLTADMEVQP